MTAPADDAAGSTDNDRFVVHGKLGAGGMGVVYRAHDRLSGRDVALKTLKTSSGRDLYRFKREFRGLCDLVHPNLCALYELHTTGDEWFFTMELVQGVSFIDRVRPTAERERDAEQTLGSDDTRPGGRLPRTRAEVMEAVVDLGRLEDALGQLCDGLHALHAAGKLHRDLKPSNVLCEPDGRVVLLDFGLVADVERVAVENTHDHSAVGTPAYMSPEQAADAPLTAASDWYAVGVMLYEALVGRRPFEGKADDVMRRKQLEVPPRPRDLAPATPPRLDALCMAMLAASAEARPDGVAVLAALGRTPSSATAIVERAAGGGLFVGREAQLATLEQALFESRQAGVAVLVHGSSGMGKSALCGRFLAGLRGRAIVLSGRCYQRESTPFKTLDALVDALTGLLLKFEAEQVAEVLPADVVALARLFPVLRRVPQIAEPEIRRFHVVDAQELRRRGFAALRELLAAIAARRPLVLAVDDLQWGDADSAVFLGDLITRADRPRALVLLVYRSEDAGSPVITAVQRRAAGDPADVRHLDVAPLALDDARELVRALAPDDEVRTDALVREAGGNTMFLAELARAAADPGVGATTLDDLLRRRIARLPDDARALLRACAVAARPTAIETVARAAGVADTTGPLAVLRVERLVRPTQTEAIEAYHDRIRVAILDELAPPELRGVHARLAEAYRADTGPGRDAIVDHLLGAGDRAGAAREAEHAAERAAGALAFARSAELYDVALRHGSAAGGERMRLLRARADALVDAGHPALAARTYAEAATLATGDLRRRLELARIENTLRAGELATGVELARELLAQHGYTLPASRGAAVRKMIGQRLWLRLRGLGFDRRRTPLSDDEQRTSDVLWSVASGITFADPVLGKVVQHWHLRHALELGEPGRIVNALALEVGYVATEGEPRRAKVDRLEARARALATEVGDPYHQAFLDTCDGMARSFLGDWREGGRLIEAGLDTMREHGGNARWQVDIAEIFLLGILFYLGDVAGLIRTFGQFLRDAELRGDVYSQHGIKTWRGGVAFLCLDQPEVARAQLEEVARQRGASPDFTLHDFYHLCSQAQIDVYRGDGPAALARIAREQKRLDGSHLQRVQTLRIEIAFLEGRAAVLAALADRGDRARHLAVARKLAAALRGEPAAWGQAVGTALTAAIEHAAGDLAAARAAYDDARDRFRAADMALHERCMIVAKAELDGGSDQTALEWMRAQGVGAPLTLTRFLAPRPR